MKTITEEIKAKIFAQYYYCQVLGKYIDSDELDPIEIMNTCLVDYIELNLLSNINDEYAIGVSKIFGEVQVLCDELHSDRGKRIIKSGKENFKLLQYLQSKGYALPYLDYSVNDLVELGVYKLI